MTFRPILLGAVLAVAAGCGDGGTGPRVAEVVSVVVQGPASSVTIGGTLQLVAHPRDANGLVVSGRAVSWSTSHPAIASISTTGLVTGLVPGQATLAATVDGVTGQFTITVTGPPNLAIARAWLTQGTQRPDGSIPLVQDGLPALLNVIGTIQPAFPAGAPPLRVRIYEGDALRLEETRLPMGPGTAVADDGNPLYQVLVPANLIRAGLRVEVVANPGATVPEDRLDDNSWPAAGGPAPIAVRQVAPLEVHFVPVLLTVGGSVGTVTPTSLTEYMHAVRQMFPLGQVAATIGEVFSTDVDFGSGAPAAWTQILPQLDMLRVIEGTTRYYVGALRPPPGVTFVQNGGWGYIPFNPLSHGPGTRTSLVVGVGWFSRQAATRELVAHELGHNHARRHAPCGNPAGPDLLYPHAGATLGVWTHDVYSFAAGLTMEVRSLGPQVGFDLMSYCNPVWTSDYSYEGILNVRSALAATAPAPAEPCDCLLVWGTAAPSGIELGPVFATRAHVALPGATGTHLLEGVDHAGRVLFGGRFTPAEVDHAPGIRQFLFAIPRTMTGGAARAAVRVTDPSGRVGLAPQGDVLAPPVTARRVSPDGVELRWDAARTPGVLVRDPATARVLGIGRSGRLVVRSGGAELEVTESRGMASYRSRLSPP